MSLRDDLIAAKALIDTPEKWGKGTDTYSGHSATLCAHGACLRVSNGWNQEMAMRRALQSQISRDWLIRNGGKVPLGASPTPTFNDDPTTTHADIMALFDRAIAAAGASDGE